MNTPEPTRFVMLVILDGWGIAAPNPGNAMSLAKTVNMNRFTTSFPHTQLEASGESVGLPRGEPGNTETGHLNLGAGRIVYQDLARINMAIADGSFYKNQCIQGAFDHALKFNSNVHFLGLIGAGGVHSNIEHLFALIRFAKQNNFSRVYLHLFTDGRDSPTMAAKTYISQVRSEIAKEGVSRIASIMGRYWAMDRDLRWDRTEKAYLALTLGQGHLVKTPEEAIEFSYSQGKTDEFIEPSIITDIKGVHLRTKNEHDSIIFFNFRIDRPRQLSRAFVFEDFSKANIGFGFDPYAVKYEKKHMVEKIGATQAPFNRGPKIKNLYFAMMTEYGGGLTENGANAAFPPEAIEIPLGRVISEAGFKQLRCSESEKERFVTYYFNGQRELTFPGEDRLIIPSPKVPTYDQKPEMSAQVLTEELLARLRNFPDYRFVVVNFANVDMVGHTGNIGAAVKACEVVDECLGKLSNFILAYGGVMIITADHGNAEEMINSNTGEINTEHTRNPVPFVVISKDYLSKPQTLSSGILADVAPTVLKLLNLNIPPSMGGQDLLKELSGRAF